MYCCRVTEQSEMTIGSGRSRRTEEFVGPEPEICLKNAYGVNEAKKKTKIRNSNEEFRMYFFVYYIMFF